VKRRVGPGLYEDEDGALHLSVPDFLRAHGIPDTPENRQTILDAAREALAEHFPGVPIREED
jgi:hypothetical protein